MCPIFRSRFLAQRYPRRYIYSSLSSAFFLYSQLRPLSFSPLSFFCTLFLFVFFFITRVSAMHTGCHRRQFARKLQLKNIALWPVDRRPRWESSPGWNGSRDCSLQFVRVKNWRGLGGKGAVERDGLKRVYGRRWQADGFGLRQRRRDAGKRKREIFHGFLYCRCCRALYSFKERFYLIFDPYVTRRRIKWSW